MLLLLLLLVLFCRQHVFLEFIPGIIKYSWHDKLWKCHPKVWLNPAVWVLLFDKSEVLKRAFFSPVGNKAFWIFPTWQPPDSQEFATLKRASWILYPANVWQIRGKIGHRLKISCCCVCFWWKYDGNLQSRQVGKKGIYRWVTLSLFKHSVGMQWISKQTIVWLIFWPFFN